MVDTGIQLQVGQRIISPHSLNSIYSVESFKKGLKKPQNPNNKKVFDMLGEIPEKSLLRAPVAVKDSGIHPSSL